MQTKQDVEHYNKITKLSKSDLEKEYMEVRKDMKIFILLAIIYVVGLFIALGTVMYTHNKIINDNNHYISEISKDICGDNYLFSIKSTDKLVIVCSDKRHEYKRWKNENE